MLLVSYEPAFEMRRSNVAYIDHFFFVFLCAAIFFAFLVLDFFFNISMDFSFDEIREEMQKKIF